MYHCVNSGVTTWLGIAEEIARLLRRDAELIPVKSTEVKLKAKRPVYCALSNDKLKAAGIAMPTWQEALGRYVGYSLIAVRSPVSDQSTAQSTVQSR